MKTMKTIRCEKCLTAVSVGHSHICNESSLVNNIMAITDTPENKKAREILASKIIKEKAAENKEKSELKLHTQGRKLTVNVGKETKGEQFSAESMMNMQNDKNFSDRQLL